MSKASALCLALPLLAGIARAGSVLGPSFGWLRCNGKPMERPMSDCYHEVTFGEKLNSLCGGNDEKLQIRFDPAGSGSGFEVSIMYSDVQVCDYPAKSAATSSNIKQWTGGVQLAKGQLNTIGDAISFPSKNVAGTCGPGNLILGLKDETDAVVDAVAVPIRFKSCTVQAKDVGIDAAVANDYTVPGSGEPDGDLGANILSVYGKTKISLQNSNSCPDLKAMVCMTCYGEEYDSSVLQDKTKRVEYIAQRLVGLTPDKMADYILDKCDPAHSGSLVTRANGETYLDVTKVAVPKKGLPEGNSCVLTVIVDMFKECLDVNRANNFAIYLFNHIAGTEEDICKVVPSSTTNGDSAYILGGWYDKWLMHSGGHFHKVPSDDLSMKLDLVAHKTMGSLEDACPRQCDEMYARVTAEKGRLHKVIQAASGFLTVVEAKVDALKSHRPNDLDLARYGVLASFMNGVGKMLAGNDRLAQLVIGTAFKGLAGRATVIRNDTCVLQEATKKSRRSCGSKFDIVESLRKFVSTCQSHCKPGLDKCLCDILWSPDATPQGICRVLTFTNKDKANFREVARMGAHGDFPKKFPRNGEKVFDLLLKVIQDPSLLGALHLPVTTESTGFLLDEIIAKLVSVVGVVGELDGAFPRLLANVLTSIKSNPEDVKATTDLLLALQGVKMNMPGRDAKHARIGRSPTKEEFCAQVRAFKWSRKLKCELHGESMGGKACSRGRGSFEDEIPIVWSVEDKTWINKGTFNTMTGSWHWELIAKCKCGA